MPTSAQSARPRRLLAPTAGAAPRRGRLCQALLLAMLYAAPLYAAPAKIDIYAFDAHGPLTDIEVRGSDGSVQRPDIYGTLSLQLPAGEHRLLVYRGEVLLSELPLRTVEDEIAEIILTVEADGSTRVSTESSHGGSATQSAAEVAAGPPGVLEGVVISADDGKPVAGARIYVSGTPIDVSSDAEGRFRVELGAGEYALSVLAASFGAQTVSGVVIVSEQSIERRIELTPAGLELPEFVVLEPFVEGSLAAFVEERRTSSAVTDVLGAEQIARSGDSDAAGALKRVTGLTLVDGKFVYVRGLGERYSSALLNGAQIPSPDPTRRVVPLDLFPTDILQGIVIQKTFSPDMPGEFGGGTIQLRTRGVPEAFTAKFSISADYLDGTSFEDGLVYDGGKRDFTGFDRGARELPRSLAEATAGGRELKPRSNFNPDGLTPAQLEVVGDDLASGFGTRKVKLAPNMGFSGALGNVYQIGQARFGFLGAMRYKNSWDNSEEVRSSYNPSGNQLFLASQLDRRKTEQNIELSGFFNMGLELGEQHTFKSTTVLVRQTSDQTQFSEGFPEDPEDRSRFYELEWVENELISQQVGGAHVFKAAGDLALDWQWTHASASRYSPFTRNYRYDLNNRSREFLFSRRADSNGIVFSELDDQADEYSLQLARPWIISEGVELLTSGGATLLQRDRTSEIRRFTYSGGGSIDNDQTRLAGGIDTILNPANIGPTGFFLQEVTRSTDSYLADQELRAAFVNLDLRLWDKLRFNLGVRQEHNVAQVVTFALSGNNRVETNIDAKDMLPAAGLTWFVDQNSQLRAGYSKTVSRPEFRELSSAPFTDPLLDTEAIGNPNLLSTSIKNYDLRYEFYFSGSESVSLGLFYKDFLNPIEKITLPSTGALLSFANAQSATNYGAEIDIYKNFSFLEQQSWAKFGNTHWANIYVSGNYSWIESEIDLGTAGEANTEALRPLQGQSPYVVNAQIGYLSPSGKEASLVYNRFGRRISEVGVQGAPSTFEEAFDQLDLVFKYPLSKQWTLKGKIKNLLDPEVLFRQGAETTRISTKGREFGFSIEWKP